MKKIVMAFAVAACASSSADMSTLIPGANVGQTTELGGETAVGAHGSRPAAFTLRARVFPGLSA